MAGEKADIARRVYETFNQGDFDDALRFMHPDIEWQTYIVPGPGGGTYRGHQEVLQLWDDASNIFAEFRNEPERFFEHGDDVVVFVRFTGTGRGSGADVEASLAHVITFRDGLVVRVRTLDNRDDALRSVGIES